MVRLRGAFIRLLHTLTFPPGFVLGSASSATELVPEQDDIADWVGFEQFHWRGRVMGKFRRADESGGRWIPEEEWPDSEMQFVGQVLCQELGVHRGAAFDHEASYPATTEITENFSQFDGLAGIDHRGQTRQLMLQLLHEVGRAVEEFLAVS